MKYFSFGTACAVIAIASFASPVFASPVSPASTLLTPSEQHVALGSTASLTVSVRDNVNNPVLDTRVTMHWSGALTALDGSQVWTDGNGNATFRFQNVIPDMTTFDAFVNEIHVGNTASIWWDASSAPIFSSTNSSYQFPNGTSVPADGRSNLVIRVLVRDQNNRPMTGKNVHIFYSGNIGTTHSDHTTDSSGNAEFPIVGTIPGTYSVYANVDGAYSVASIPSITFTSISSNVVSSAYSSITTSLNNPQIDQTTEYAVNLRDANNFPIQKYLTLVMQRPNGTTWSQEVLTDSNGRATLNVTYSQSGTWVTYVEVSGLRLGISNSTYVGSGYYRDNTTSYYAAPVTQYNSPSCVSTPGNLVKLPDDGNPATQEDTTVYYYGRDCMRHSFPNAEVYFSWYPDFNGLTIVSADVLARMPLGRNVTFRPGQFVKMQTDPRVYVATRGGVLRLIPSENFADTFFGSIRPLWRHQIHDINEAFIVNYQQGPSLDWQQNFNLTSEMERAPTIDDNF